MKQVADIKEYIVYLCPDGSILTDWNETTWKYGYPYYPKNRCIELERGVCEGGPALVELASQMSNKYKDHQE